ncbi:cob(I)yrinic acid a,c-diamide adenosyltransferase [Acetobacteraceae bacterium KSS8]|uniref:Corrinoid adenosyltransferase n=1 Tax=Endosaccharibacter trunci TaxID=2812733 RepID=A0ABT1W2X1_9PROT|nr:cob(I)yrinic acid a,c-diamide adenosyltransferase [Acetobacteraceae bacterium KSS8]
MPIRIDQVVTRSGDAGLTSLGDGTRAAKDAVRVEAYGTVDEANSALGVLRAHLDDRPDQAAALRRIQNGLFDLGGDLCIPGVDGRFRLGDALLAFLDAEIDRMAQAQLPLDSFVLPGGSLAAAQAHLVRAIVRRAERRVVTLASAETVNPLVVQTLNRLSDYCFVLARHLNDDGRADILWERASG